MIELDEETKELMEEIKEKTEKCWNCNFCFSTCPMFQAGKGWWSYGPSGLTWSLYYGFQLGLLDKAGPEAKELVNNIYACTTCNACTNTCRDLSASVPVLEIIEKGRMYLIERGIGPLTEQKKVLESLFNYGNPYGLSSKKRLNWRENLEVKILPQQKADVLYFVGDAASYETELENLPCFIVKLFQFFGVDFGVLEEEKSCGELALKIGDRGLFEELSDQNIASFKKSGVKTIVTTSPHCMNLFKNEYDSYVRDNFEIKHYTEFFADLLSEKNIAFPKEFPHDVTFHDPCYLAKHNDITEPPRNLLKAVPKLRLKEMKLSGRDSLCCGGGGGRLFADVDEEKRPEYTRVEHALEVGVNVVATACPWCNTMLRTAITDLKADDKIRVMDVAEILVEALEL
jgi:Fe-S oxidoreductase